MIRTYVDTSVFINAKRGSATELAKRSGDILTQHDRRLYLSSYFLRLELLPYAVRGGKKKAAELEFLVDFLKRTKDEADVGAVLERTMELLFKVDLSILDAAHIMAAEMMEAEELFTSDEAFLRAEEHVTTRIVIVR